MKDALGNELQRGDVVSLRLDHIIGVITELDSGQIARGVSLVGPQPQGQLRPATIVIRVETTTAFVSADGSFGNLVKVHKPTQQTSSDVNKSPLEG